MGAKADVITTFDQKLFGLPTTATMNWAAGWSTIAPFSIPKDVNSYYIIYNKSNGQVHFDQVNKGGAGAETKYDGKWAGGWTHMVPFVMNDSAYFLAYNQASGEAHINQVLPGATNFKNVWTGKWASGWTSLNTFYADNKLALLAYNKVSGLVHTDWINTNLQGTQTVKELQWGPGFDQMVVYSNKQKAPKLIAYNSSTGTLHADALGMNGVDVQSNTTEQKGLIVSVAQSSDFDGNRKANVLLYSPSTGNMKVRHIGDDGAVISSSSTNWAKNLSHLTSFYLMDILPFDGGVLAYNQSTGNSQFFRVNDRSKLKCTGLKKCEFKNLPLLSQVDANIPDVPYKAAKQFGCYDTSITMSMAGALNNSKLSPYPAEGTRSNEYKDLMAKSGTNQYSLTKYQYDTAMAKKPFYFSEVLNDFDTASIAKNPAACDMMSIYNCNSAQNKFGDFSQRYVSTTTKVSNDDMIDNVLSGALQIIAFNWSKNDVKPGLKVVTSNGSYHKVVVAGFDKNSDFPLLINNPGAGTRENARLVASTAGANLKLVDTKGVPVTNWTMIEFASAPGQLYFLDHIDHFRMY
jgi:hypothetical protein